MSGRQPICRLTFKSGEANYSILSIWPGSRIESYSISRDKGTDKYPAIGLFEALKRWGQGDGYLNVWWTGNASSSGDSSGGRRQERQQPRQQHEQDEFEDDDSVPF